MKLQFWCGGMLENAATCTRLLRIRSIHAFQDNSGAKKDSNEFLSWLRRKARAEVCSLLSIGMCCYGRSLIAAGTIHKGDCIMRIPYSVLITPDKLPKEVESFLRKNASNYARLALFILAEKKFGKESSWAPYICSLPQAGVPHYMVIADKDYTIGEQVSISYGKFSHATLLVDFGFALQHNPYDQVEIFVSLSQKDPLLESKLNLLHMNNMPTLLDAHGNDTAGNTFVIKEVKSVRGRGMGIPHSLRAFVRVQCASSLRVPATNGG